jgi:hypothetical protein
LVGDWGWLTHEAASDNVEEDKCCVGDGEEPDDSYNIKRPDRRKDTGMSGPGSGFRCKDLETGPKEEVADE